MKKIVIGHISEISGNSARVVRAGDKEIAVFKLSTGEIKAIENKCPHKGGKLSEGIVCSHHVYCPLHDWKISLHDGLVQAPDEGSVTTYKVEIDEKTGQVILYTAEKINLVS